MNSNYIGFNINPTNTSTIQSIEIQPEIQVSSSISMQPIVRNALNQLPCSAPSLVGLKRNNDNEQIRDDSNQRKKHKVTINPQGNLVIRIQNSNMIVQKSNPCDLHLPSEIWNDISSFFYDSPLNLHHIASVNKTSYSVILLNPLMQIVSLIKQSFNRSGIPRLEKLQHVLTLINTSAIPPNRSLLYRYIFENDPELKGLSQLLHRLSSERANQVSPIEGSSSSSVQANTPNLLEEWILKDRFLMRECLRRNPMDYQHLHPCLLHDLVLATTAYRNNPGVLIFVPENLHQEIILRAEVFNTFDENDDGDFHQLLESPNFPLSLRNDFSFFLDALTREGGYLLEFAGEDIKKNDTIVTATIIGGDPDSPYDAYLHADQSLKEDPKIAFIAIKDLYTYGHGPEAFLKIIDGSLLKNFDFAMEVIKLFPQTFNEFDLSLQNDREFCLAAAKINGLAIKYMNSGMRQNRAIVLAAVNNSSAAMDYADESFQSDFEIALASLRMGDENPFKYIHESLKSNKAFILKAAKISYYTLKHASTELKADFDIFMAAIKSNTRALGFADLKFRSDRTIVLNAVQIDGTAWHHASPELQLDREIVLAAMKQNALIFKFIAPALQTDRDIVLAAIKSNCNSITLNTVEDLIKAIKTYKNDREILIAASELNPLLLIYIPHTLKSDREFNLAIMKKNGLALEFAYPLFQSDREIVLAALSQNGMAIKFIDKSLHDDQEIALVALRQNGVAISAINEKFTKIYKFVHAALQAPFKESSLMGLTTEGGPLFWVDKAFHQDEDLMLLAVKQNGMALQHLSKELRNNFKIVYHAVLQNPRAIMFIGPLMQGNAVIIEMALKDRGKSNFDFTKFALFDYGTFEETLDIKKLMP